MRSYGGGVVKTAALVIGIDEYATHPLSSAANDARAFKMALIDLGLVEEKDVYLMTAPRGDSQELPERKKITNKLYEYYTRGDTIDRFYFFFAGHGMSAFSDDSHSRLCTALIPKDLTDLNTEGHLLINFHEIRDRFSQAGPSEQFFFIDACRDLDYKLQPVVGHLGWIGGPPPGAMRSQSVLWAVKPLGTAQGVIGEHGRMTTLLLDALKSDRLAVEYNDHLSKWVVTVQSLGDYVIEMMELALASEPLWKQKYNLPVLESSKDPHAGVIRLLDSAPITEFVIKIEPEEAEKETTVNVLLRGVLQGSWCLPPRKSGEKLQLPPQCYRLESTSTGVPIVPEAITIDARRQVFQLFAPKDIFSKYDSGTKQAPTTGMSLSKPQVFSEKRGIESKEMKAITINTGEVSVNAHEPETVIELESLEKPGDTWTDMGMLSKTVSPGAYRVRFRLGWQVFNETDIYVKPSEIVKISPTMQMTPLVSEALQTRPEVAPTTTIFSESIGPMQAGVLQTMLPIIGIKAFDTQNEMLHQFYHIVPTREPEDYGRCSFSLVVAVDGNNWTVPVKEVLESIQAMIVIGPDEDGDIKVIIPKLEMLQRPTLAYGSYGMVGEGLERIRLAMLQSPAEQFWLEFESLHMGRHRLACAALQGRATVVTLTLNPDGELEISQNLLRFPNREMLYSDELRPHVNYGRMIRDLQLGQKLFESGELPKGGNRNNTLQDLLYAKWTDPVLSCMGYYALRRDQPGKISGIIGETARNLVRFFGKLPDSWVIFGEVFEEKQRKLPEHIYIAGEQREVVVESRDQVYSDLLARNAIPILAESTRRLAGYAIQKGYDHLPVVEIARRIPPDQIWTINMM